MGFTHTLHTQPDRNRHRLDVHSNKGIADIQTGVGLEVFHSHGSLHIFIGAGGKAAAGFWLGHYIDNVQPQFPGQVRFDDQRPVEMLTALRCQPQSFFRQDQSDGGMDFLRCFIAGVGADLFAQYLTGRTADDNDVPTVQSDRFREWILT